jgi:hypothetical protein
MLEYFHHFIREQQQKQIEGKDNAEIICSLQQMMKDYLEELNLVKENISSTVYNFHISEQIYQIFILVQQIYELPIHGKLIEEQINGVNEGRAQAATSTEQYVDLPIGFNSSQIILTLKDIVNKTKR